MNKDIKIGLALGSGGWRGLAHVGVIKALEEAGIKIDYIAGSSAGALVGGLYASFGDVKKLEEFFLKFGYRDILKIISDPHLKTGFLKGKKAESYLRNITSDKKIEELKKIYCAVATDIKTGKTVYIKEGSLAEAIRASCSVPVLFDPLKVSDKYLVDGGSTEPIPVKAVRSMGANFVIAVNLNTGFFPLRDEDLFYKTKIALASSRVMIDKLAEYNCKEADICIFPKIPNQKVKIKITIDWILKFVKEKELIKIGEQSAKDKIKEIKEKIGALI